MMNASSIRNAAVHKEVSNRKVSALNFFLLIYFISKHSDHIEYMGHPIVMESFMKDVDVSRQNVLEIKISRLLFRI